MTHALRVCPCPLQKPKVKSTPWGSTYRAAPEILHGYSSKVGVLAQDGGAGRPSTALVVHTEKKPRPHTSPRRCRLLQVTGKSASERLDMRAATKSDKFAK